MRTAVMAPNLSGNLVPMDPNLLALTPSELQRTLACKLHDIDPDTGKTNMELIADNVIGMAKSRNKLGLEAAREVMDRVLGKSRQSIETLSVTATLGDYLDRLGTTPPSDMAGNSPMPASEILEAEGL